MIQPVNHSNQVCWHTIAKVSAITTALSIITATAIFATMGMNTYVYGMGALSVASLVSTAISYCISHRNHETPSEPIRNSQPSMSPVIHRELLDRASERTEITKISVTIEHFDPEHFTNWLLARNPSPQKRRLIESTLLRALPRHQLEGRTIVFYQSTIPRSDFEAMLHQPLNEAPNVLTDHNWFDYSDHGHTYLDFANAYTFGGGWRGEGNVQEETMFLEFFDLALLAYATRDRMIRPATGNPGDPSTEPTPFIIPHLSRQFRIDPSLYGRRIYRVDAENIPERVHESPSEPVTITGIAACSWGGSCRYSLRDLKYHLKAAYLAFMGERLLSPEHPVVHTAPWGCGVFNNSEMMITSLQILAAKMAGVDLVFHGVGNQMNPNYHELQIHDLKVNVIDRWHTPLEALNELLRLQQQDPVRWAPKS